MSIPQIDPTLPPALAVRSCTVAIKLEPLDAVALSQLDAATNSGNHIFNTNSGPDSTLPSTESSSELDETDERKVIEDLRLGPPGPFFAPSPPPPTPRSPSRRRPLAPTRVLGDRVAPGSFMQRRESDVSSSDKAPATSTTTTTLGKRKKMFRPRRSPPNTKVPQPMGSSVSSTQAKRNEGGDGDGDTQHLSIFAPAPMQPPVAGPSTVTRRFNKRPNDEAETGTSGGDVPATPARKRRRSPVLNTPGSPSLLFIQLSSPEGWFGPRDD